MVEPIKHWKLNEIKCLRLFQARESSATKIYEDIGYHDHDGGIRAITFLGNQPSFKNFDSLEILIWEPMGKSQYVQYIVNG